VDYSAQVRRRAGKKYHGAGSESNEVGGFAVSGSPLIFVRDGRTLPYFPVTHNALAAIEIAASADEEAPRRLAAARSLYLALLEMANRGRSARVPASRKRLGELAGISRDLVSDVRPILERAQVVTVIEHHHAGHRLENEWVLCEPPEQAEEDMPGSRHPVAESQGVEAVSHDPRGREPQRSEEGEEEHQDEDSLRSSSREVERSNSGRQDVDSLCMRLASLMLANDPKARIPKTAAAWKRWQDAARLLIDADERHYEEADAVLGFSQRDDFEKSNILSMPKFRERYPQLRLKWMREQRPSNGAAAAPPVTTADLMAAYERRDDPAESRRRRAGVR
jgi:hypothetical protein